MTILQAQGAGNAMQRERSLQIPAIILRPNDSHGRTWAR